jgi:hypothetical protein
MARVQNIWVNVIGPGVRGGDGKRVGQALNIVFIGDEVQKTDRDTLGCSLRDCPPSEAAHRIGQSEVASGGGYACDEC